MMMIMVMMVVAEGGGPPPPRTLKSTTDFSLVSFKKQFRLSAAPFNATRRDFLASRAGWLGTCRVEAQVLDFILHLISLRSLLLRLLPGSQDIAK